MTREWAELRLRWCQQELLLNIVLMSPLQLLGQSPVHKAKPQGEYEADVALRAEAGVVVHWPCHPHPL